MRGVVTPARLRSGDVGASRATKKSGGNTRFARSGRVSASVTGAQLPRQYGVEIQRPAPLRLPAHAERESLAWKQWALGLKEPRAVDLFCGGGGLSLGLEQAGYRVILAVDHDPWAVETHAHNFGGLALRRDLGDPETIEALSGLLKGVSVDLIAGGPPCQPFSRAGRSKIRSLVNRGQRDAIDQRTGLWSPFIRLVEIVRPTAVLMENVPDMALGDDLATVRLIVARLEAAGYDAVAALLDAWRYSVPQHRQRLILVARRDGLPFSWPSESGRMTLRDAIGDLPRLGDTSGEPEMRYGGSRNAFQRNARRGMRHSAVWDHVTRPVREDDRRAFRLLRPGMRYADLPEELRRYRDDIFDDKYNRLSWSDLSRSITAHIAKDGYWYIHPSEARTLTVREAARIQTFPDRFRFAGARSHAFEQIGNAVPPALATAVARRILKGAHSRSGPRERSSERVSRIRERLLAWAAEDAIQHPWRHPGDPWSVFVGVVLDPRASNSTAQGVQQFLQVYPTPRRVSRARVAQMASALDDRHGAALDGLRSAACLLHRKDSWGNQKWVAAAKLGLAEETFVRIVGLGEDGLLTNISPLRVAARLSGHLGDQQNRLSHGRMVIGAIVGSGEHVPALNAALNALGATVCTASDPACGSCPLVEDCSYDGRNRPLNGRGGRGIH